jgi:hypothetical protein
MQTPVIIQVFDQKLHSRGVTVVDYDQWDSVIEAIKETCEKNYWTYKTTIPATAMSFIDKVNTQGNT